MRRHLVGNGTCPPTLPVRFRCDVPMKIPGALPEDPRDPQVSARFCTPFEILQSAQNTYLTYLR